MDGIRITVMASQLLRDAATFFVNVSEQNAHLAEQMVDNAEVYRMVADRLDAGDSSGLSVEAETPVATIEQLAAKLLDDAATFFDNVGSQNPALEDQMTDNAEVYRRVASLMLIDPDIRLPADA